MAGFLLVLISGAYEGADDMVASMGAPPDRILVGRCPDQQVCQLGNMPPGEHPHVWFWLLAETQRPGKLEPYVLAEADHRPFERHGVRYLGRARYVPKGVTLPAAKGSTTSDR